VNLVRLKKPQITYSPLFADYRPKTNALILLDMGHTLRGRTHTGRIGKGKETKT
jgi:hypothetical protein